MVDYDKMIRISLCDSKVRERISSYNIDIIWTDVFHWKENRDRDRNWHVNEERHLVKSWTHYKIWISVVYTLNDLFKVTPGLPTESLNHM